MSLHHAKQRTDRRGRLIFGVTAILFGVLWVGIEVLLLSNAHLPASTIPLSNVLFLFVATLLAVGVPTLATVSGVGSVLRYVWDRRIGPRIASGEKATAPEAALGSVSGP